MVKKSGNAMEIVSSTRKSLKMKVYEFFVGLNRELDDVMGRILGLCPLPSTHKVFMKVRRDDEDGES